MVLPNKAKLIRSKQQMQQKEGNAMAFFSLSVLLSAGRCASQQSKPWCAIQILNGYRVSAPAKEHRMITPQKRGLSGPLIPIWFSHKIIRPAPTGNMPKKAKLREIISIRNLRLTTVQYRLSARKVISGVRKINSPKIKGRP